ncbi:methyltransferase [Streptomyces sp. NPDC053069]|uniref:methyltransferase n=1 Tax=Streptomyces sp. NPDC053069 TaxID=3365695 RepID=UPI0037D14C6A
MTSAPSDVNELSATLSEHMNGFLYTASLYTVTRFGIAEHLVDGPRTPAELAGLAGVNGPHLHRILRYLATRDVFREDEQGRFHLTPMANLLRPDVPGSLRDSFLMLGNEELYWKPMGRLHETVRTGHTVFDDMYGAQFFPYLQTVPELSTLFNSGTAGFSRQWIGQIAASYDFPDGARVVDVGGGRGDLLRGVLAAHPGITGTLYDQESVLAEHRLDVPELAGRWSVQAGDFFERVPAGYDYYFLKSVLHDWSDDDCLRILKSVREGMREDSRLLVVDPVIPRGNEPHASKTIDAMMMVIHDGKERTQEEFEEILGTAGFSVLRTLPTPGLMSIVEATVA